MQSFLMTPNFSKTFFYKEPQDLYQTFCNTYAYYKQASYCNPTPNHQKLFQECNLTWKQIKHKDKTLIKENICRYFNTIPSYIRSHQSNFIQNRVNNSNSTPSLFSFKINNIHLQRNIEVPRN